MEPYTTHKKTISFGTNLLEWHLVINSLFVGFFKGFTS